MSRLLLSSMKRPIVYIAYSLTDSQWKDRFVAAMRPLNTIVHTQTFDDIKLGQDWKAQLRRVLSDADVAILLISPAFLESEFIASVEIPALLKRREREGLLIVPLVIESCRWEDISWLRTIHVRSLPDDLTDLARDQPLYSIAKQILGHVSDDEGAQATGPATQSADPRLIFISHSHDDHEFARLLKKRLEKNKLKAWIATDRLEAGVNWTGEIDQAIRQAAAVVVIMTPKSAQSQYVTYEWAYALGAGTRVIPVIWKPTRFHSHMQHLQYIDFTKVTATQKSKLPWSELIRVIKQTDGITAE
jgi:hypothetical protein